MSMNIEDATVNQLRDTIVELISEGKLSLEDVEYRLKGGISKDMMGLVEITHTVMCTSSHEADGCSFYEESRFDDAWASDAHKVWTAYTMDMMNRYRLDVKTMLTQVIRLPMVKAIIDKEKMNIEMLINYIRRTYG